jgi:S1-C subfamily serine protease
MRRRTPRRRPPEGAAVFFLESVMNVMVCRCFLLGVIALAWAGQIIGKDASGAPPSNNTAASTQPAATGGTGFAFTHDGIIVTNAHVIAGCHAIFAVTSGRTVSATIVAQDQANDLAAIRADGITFDRVVTLTPPNTTAIGEKAVTYGFPLYGALASDGNFTIGYVSALSGMRDDGRFMQISTPVQPGNSGGPLLDVTGNLIGVVTGKLDAVKMERIAGALPENVNFAIKAQTLAVFLQKNNIPLNAQGPRTEKTDVELAALGHAVAVRISCTN